MNNIANELLGKALDKQVPYTWHSLNRVQLDDVMKEFAELLVKECTEQVWYTREHSINGNISEVIKQRIKQHFGVQQ